MVLRFGPAQTSFGSPSLKTGSPRVRFLLEGQVLHLPLMHMASFDQNDTSPARYLLESLPCLCFHGLPMLTARDLM